VKYKDFEGTIEDLALLKLKEIEQAQNIKILYAVESGSRAWGFASPDSDYDVRFIYVRPKDYYLGLEPKRDFIDWELNETLDINGWDIAKALQHFHKSNATVFEWANSPMVYYTTPEWRELAGLAEKYFSCKVVMYHYYGTARKNYLEHLTEETVKYKKYFYVLRPLLACKWIEEKACPPPVLFQKLIDGVLEEQLKPVVEKLVETKMQMKEAEKGVRIETLHAYIEQKLEYYKQKAELLSDDRNPDWEELNHAFIRLLA